MNPSTFTLSPEYDTFQGVAATSRLLEQARALRAALADAADTADAGPCVASYRRLARLEDAAWKRYNRRVYAYNVAADVHWGAL